MFALGAAGASGARRTASLYRRFVRPRLGPPAELEDAARRGSPRPSGSASPLVGARRLLAGVDGRSASSRSAFALAAAFLNAAFGFCLGCEVYLLIRARATARASPTRPRRAVLTGRRQHPNRRWKEITA